MEKVIDYFDVILEGHDRFMCTNFRFTYDDVTLPQVFKLLEYYFKAKDYDVTDVNISYQYGIPDDETRDSEHCYIKEIVK